MFLSCFTCTALFLSNSALVGSKARIRRHIPWQIVAIKLVDLPFVNKLLAVTFYIRYSKKQSRLKIDIVPRQHGENTLGTPKTLHEVSLQSILASFQFFYFIVNWRRTLINYFRIIWTSFIPKSIGRSVVYLIFYNALCLSNWIRIIPYHFVLESFSHIEWVCLHA